jgi:hypothetical protein
MIPLAVYAQKNKVGNAHLQFFCYEKFVSWCVKRTLIGGTGILPVRAHRLESLRHQGQNNAVGCVLRPGGGRDARPTNLFVDHGWSAVSWAIVVKDTVRGAHPTFYV